MEKWLKSPKSFIEKEIKIENKALKNTNIKRCEKKEKLKNDI